MLHYINKKAGKTFKDMLEVQLAREMNYTHLKPEI